MARKGTPRPNNGGATGNSGRKSNEELGLGPPLAQGIRISVDDDTKYFYNKLELRQKRELLQKARKVFEDAYFESRVL